MDPTLDRLTEALDRLRERVDRARGNGYDEPRSPELDWVADLIAEERKVALADRPEPGELDAAWAEAEAALPEGWWLHTLSAWSFDDMAYYVEAASAGSADYSGRSAKDKKYGTVRFYGGKRATAYGPTPAAALRALAAALREAR